MQLFQRAEPGDEVTTNGIGMLACLDLKDSIPVYADLLAAEGVAILMISSDMEEILGNSDRIAVMHEGRVTGILQGADCTQEAIMSLAVA